MNHSKQKDVSEQQIEAIVQKFKVTATINGRKMVAEAEGWLELQQLLSSLNPFQAGHVTVETL